MGKIIVGRERECLRLDRTMESNSSEFVAITGRRRIGKTYLINAYYEDAICFYFTGLQDLPLETQLEAFAQELSKRTKNIAPKINTWLEAFHYLKQYLSKVKSKKKKVIFFDELPWMDTPKSGFVQIFAHFWNSWAAWENNIVLVIAGSATSWIVKKIYNDRGGMHNRVTERLWLKPFTLKETEAYLKYKRVNLSQFEIAQIYMAVGGIPFYLNEIKPGQSANQIIQSLYFEPGALLRTEFDNLFHSIFNKADAHVRVIKQLAKHRYGLDRTELLKQAKITNSGGGTKILDDLLQTNYIAQMIPFGKKSNGAKYVLNDFYSMFYLNFVESKKIRKWDNQFETANYQIWCGLSFERLCFMHETEIKHALGISGVHTESSHLTLYDENKKAVAQIDLLIERKDNAFNLCEIKFTKDIYKMTEVEEIKIRKKEFYLRQKIKSRKSVFNTMITPFGCERNNMHYLGRIQAEVTLKDLFY